MLAHVELIDGVVAFLQADLGENALGGVEVGGAGRRHQLEAFEVLQRGLGVVALADDELLDAVFRALRIERDEGNDAGLLEIGIRGIDGQNDRDRVDLSRHHPADRERRHRDALHVGLDAGILEVAAVDRDEIGKRRGAPD